MTSQDAFQVRDSRISNRYAVDNAFIRGGWGAAVGPYGIAVYDVLCLHADAHTQDAWPSYSTIADLTGMSRRQAIRKIAELERLGLVHKEQERDEEGRVTRNIYYLTDQSQWRDPGDCESPGGDCQSPGSDYESPGLVTESHQGSDRESPKHDPMNMTHEHDPGNMIPADSAADTHDPDPAGIDWPTGKEHPEGQPSVLQDARAGDPIGLAAACAERQAEARANGVDPGYTVPAPAGGGDPRADAMVAAWIDAQGLDPEQFPEHILRQYRQAMIAAAEGLSASPEQAAQAVRYVLTHPDYTWCNYGHPKNAKFQRDVAGIMLQLLSGVDLATQRRETSRPVDEDKGLAMILRLEREEADSERGA
jgi:hypothetical protein